MVEGSSKSMWITFLYHHRVVSVRLDMLRSVAILLKATHVYMVLYSSHDKSLFKFSIIYETLSTPEINSRPSKQVSVSISLQNEVGSYGSDIHWYWNILLGNWLFVVLYT